MPDNPKIQNALMQSEGNRLTQLFDYIFTRRTIIPYAYTLFILTSCGTQNILSLKNKKHYFDQSIIKNDTALTLRQTVSYRSKMIDASYSYQLFLTFFDSSLAKSKRTLDAKSDTLIVKTIYDFKSVWNWEPENYTLNGSIEILNWNPNAIELKLDLFVYDECKKKKIRYKGVRLFRNSSKD